MGTTPAPATTHEIEFTGDVVAKRFRDTHRGEPEREWQALRLLHEHAPGLAPAPIRAELGAPRRSSSWRACPERRSALGP